MKEVSFLEIHKSVIVDKQLFEELCVEFYENNIFPLWVGNKKNKLEFFNMKDGLVFVAANKNELLKQIEGNKGCVDFVELVRESAGERVCWVSLLWYISSDVLNLVKYFKITSINGWVFDSGVYYGKEDKNIIYSYEHRRIFSTSWVELARLGMDPRQRKIVEDVCDNLKISGIGKLVSSGYLEYLDSKKMVPIKVPNKIENNFDFQIWQKCVGKIRITTKNFNQINYYNKEHVLGGVGGYKMDIWLHLYEIDGLGDKKYFRKRWMDVEFGEKDIVGKAISGDYLISRWKLLNEEVMFNVGRCEIVTLIQNTNMVGALSEDLVGLRKWVIKRVIGRWMHNWDSGKEGNVAIKIIDKELKKRGFKYDR